MWEELGLEKCHQLVCVQKTSVCVSGGRSGLAFPAFSLTAHFPTSALWPPLSPTSRFGMGTKCSPAWVRPKNAFTGGAKGTTALKLELRNVTWFLDYREDDSGFTHLLRHWGILVSWNPDFENLGVCRKAGAQETNGSHYSSPNFQLFWPRTGILIIFSLILQFFCLILPKDGSAHTTNLLYHVRWRGNAVPFKCLDTFDFFFLNIFEGKYLIFFQAPILQPENPSIFNLMSVKGGLNNVFMTAHMLPVCFLQLKLWKFPVNRPRSIGVSLNSQKFGVFLIFFPIVISGSFLEQN